MILELLCRYIEHSTPSIDPQWHSHSLFIHQRRPDSLTCVSQPLITYWPIPSSQHHASEGQEKQEAEEKGRQVERGGNGFSETSATGNFFICCGWLEQHYSKSRSLVAEVKGVEKR
jgi:hypothetical protein